MNWVKFEQDVRTYFQLSGESGRFILLCMLYERLYLLKKEGHAVVIDKKPRTPGSKSLTKEQRQSIMCDPRKYRYIAWDYQISIPLVCRIKKSSQN